MNTLAIIHYITNYMTKNDYNQYKPIIFAVIIQKTYRDFQVKAMVTISHVKYTTFDKFALQIFHRLAYK